MEFHDEISQARPETERHRRQGCCGANSDRNTIMVINTNLAAMVSQRNLADSTTNLQRSLSRLSTGSKIVQPQDDAAGLAMAARLDARLKRINATRSSIANAVSFVQTKDGYLGKIQSALERMSELATLAMDGTKSVSDVKLYMAEFNSLRDFIQSGLSDKTFNGIKLFTNSSQTVYANEDATEQIALKSTPINVDGATDNSASSINLQKAIQRDDKSKVSTAVINNTTAPATPITNIAGLVTANIDANTEKSWIIDTVTWSGGTAYVAAAGANPAVNGSEHTTRTVDTSTVQTANIKASLTQVTNALEKITSQRADLGADLSRLNIASDTLAILQENVAAATSRIRDVDVADESASYARYSILVQAGTAMLAQANVIPQTALRLLS